MRYIAWYTEGTIYEQIFRTHLEPTLKYYNLEYDAIAMPNYNKWHHNVAQKPIVILNALEKYKEPLVLLDVDCKITAEPILFERINSDSFDIACHFLDWKTWYNKPAGETKQELLTGTMWFNYNEKVLALCKKWHQNTWNAKCADQLTMEYLVKNDFKSIRICKLPIEYCYINSLPGDKPPYVIVNNPVITHFQASRLARRGIL